jgi:hypothetical protein
VQGGVTGYLDEVRSHLHLDPGTEGRVMDELYAHFQEKMGDLRAQGVPEPEVTRAAIDSFGDARGIARMLYESCSRGTWTEALVGSQPHLIAAALFATHAWRHPMYLGGAFVAIAVIALLGWRRGAPNWTYSWTGYALLPLLAAACFTTDPLARTLGWVLHGVGAPAPLLHLAGLALLYAVTLWLLASAAVSAARRDWILLTIALLPLPVIAIWGSAVLQSPGFLAVPLPVTPEAAGRWDAAMADFFLALGASTALFIRLRQRTLKVGAVIAAGMLGSVAATSSIWTGLGLLGIVGLAVVFLVFLTVPILIRAIAARPQHPWSPPAA